MSLIDETRAILKQYSLTAKKNFSQNFLIDEEVLEKIVEVAELKAGERVIEVGAGLGVLTAALAKTGAKVSAIEQDRDLIKILKGNFALEKNVEIMEGDALRILGQLQFFDGRQKIVANIPYAITGKLLRLLMELSAPSEKMVLLLQKEVAERLVAPVGALTILGVLAQFKWRVKIEKIVPRHSFFPVPKVDSAVVSFTPTGKNISGNLIRLIKIGFASRRQTLVNNLTSGLSVPKEKIGEVLSQIGIDKMARAQALTLENWEDLESKLAG